MKRKLLSSLIIGFLMLSLTGCALDKEVGRELPPEQQNFIEFSVLKVKESPTTFGKVSAILVDNESKVLYYYEYEQSKGKVMIPLIDKDGKPRVYTGDLSKKSDK